MKQEAEGILGKGFANLHGVSRGRIINYDRGKVRFPHRNRFPVPPGLPVWNGASCLTCPIMPGEEKFLRDEGEPDPEYFLARDS